MHETHLAHDDGFLSFRSLRREFHPIHQDGWVELRGDGWQKFQEQTERSGGAGLIIMHPAYAQEMKDIEEIHTFCLQTDERWEHARKRGSDYVRRYHLFERRIAQTIMRAQERHVPVILYIDTLDSDYSFVRTRSRVIEAIRRTTDMLCAHGYEKQGTLFYVATAPGDPFPLVDRNNDSLPERAEATVVALEESGLTYAVVGGAYFGGHQYSPRFDKMDSAHPTPIARAITRDRHPLLPATKPHPLERLDPEESCVRNFLETLAGHSSIRFRVGRGLTYPQDVPIWPEITETERHYCIQNGTELFIVPVDEE
jgi:hypothetical protein